jgi:hypothetical protein
LIRRWQTVSRFSIPQARAETERQRLNAILEAALKMALHGRQKRTMRLLNFANTCI